MLKNLNKYYLLLIILSLFNTIYLFGQVPSNDNCYGAIALTPASSCTPITGTVANATQSMAGCTGTADDDVWYSFTATQAALSVTVSGSSGFNPVVQVFSGGCSSSSSLACVNSTGNGGTEVASLSNLMIGVTYLIRVYHFAATVPTTPTFTICVSPATVMPSCASSLPAGNTCATATLICDVNGYCGSTAATYTADSWTELSGVFCGSIENNSFIKFVAESSTVSLNVWVTTSTQGSGIQVLIFSANNCSGPVTAYTCVSPLAPNPTTPSPVTASGLTPGNTYYMMIDGFAGDVCDYVIGVNSGIQIAGGITASATEVCIGTPVTLVATGGNGSYTWTASPDLSSTSGSVVTANPTTAGTHTYTMSTISMNPLCPSTPVSIDVDVYAAPIPDAGIDDSICLGDPIYLSGNQTNTADIMSWQYLATGISPTPTVTFSPNFSTLTPTITVNQPGLYRFILREINSICGTNRDTVKVWVLDPQQILSFNSPSCAGLADGEIIIDSPDANEYSFDNGVTWQTDSVGTGFAAGTYTVCSKTANGCSVCSSITVVDPPAIQFTSGYDTTICQNGTATLFALATGGNQFTYHWNFVSDGTSIQQVNPIQDEIYSVYAENEYGCLSDTNEINVFVKDPIVGSVVSGTAVCPGYSTNLTASAIGGEGSSYQFVWSSGDVQSGLTSAVTVAPTQNTSYTLIISDACESTPDTLVVPVSILPLPVPMIAASPVELCEPAIFNVSSITDASMVSHLYWKLSNGQIFTDQETIQTAELNSGQYSIQLVVTSPDGCIDSTTFTNYLTVYPKPDADFNYTPNPVKMFSTNVQLLNTTTNASYYQWTFEEGSPLYSNDEAPKVLFPDGETGNYETMLIATSDFGCIDTIVKDIIVVSEVLLYVPNSFTPDNDEYNQQWEISMQGLDPQNFTLLLFNRWGEVIWESHDPSVGWDGTFNGILVEQGTYIWTIRAKDLYSDDVREFKGHVTVLR